MLVTNFFPIMLNNKLWRTAGKTKTYYFSKAETFRIAKLLEIKALISLLSEVLDNLKSADTEKFMFFLERIAKVKRI